MRSSMEKPFKTLLILLFLLLLSCATVLPGRQYTQGSTIDMNHYSVIGPPGDGWVVNIQKDQRTVEFIKRNVSQSTGLINDTTMIRVFRNWITEERLRRLSEEEVADDFRKMEEQGMIMMGVIKGEYELSDVKKDTTMIGDKKLYFMSYRTSGWSKGPTRQKWISDSVLYLFFPADFKENYYFYCFQLGHLFMEGTLGKGDLTPIIPVINNLQIKSTQQKQSESRDAQFYYNRGNAYAGKRQYDKAISDFNKALEINPRFAEAYRERGLAYFGKGQFDQWILDSNKADEVDPKAASIFTDRGKFCVGKYQYDESISNFNKAIEIDPRFDEAYNMRGFVYGEKGQYDRASSDLNKALEVDPRFTEAYNNRGLVYWNKGQFDSAISDFNKAIEINPRPASYYINRGKAYVEKSQYEQAISDYSKALEIDPKLVEAYTKRGWAYIRKGHYDQAISDFNKALEINSWFAVAYNNRGIAYYFKKEYDKSWEDIKRAQDLGYQIPAEFLDDLRKASGREK